ncbi:MAG: hypothetical protein II930_03020 [Lachnospiraceae bacterium]|nr:hypothetical protein [Lachnospiraceae bacterium]
MALNMNQLGETLTIRAEQLAICAVQREQDMGGFGTEVRDALTRSGSDRLPEEIFYYVDLDAPYVYSMLVKSRTERSMNGYFDQLLRTKRDFARRIPAYRPEFQLTDLVYLDFSELLRKKQDDLAARLFSDGFVLRYEGRTAWMRPFDKSASMSRKSVITFVDETLMGVLDERLTLGIFRQGREYPLSKVYAYRGLYLSSGTRVRETAGEFELNEETVVVIPDTMSRRRNRSVEVYTEQAGYDPETGAAPQYGKKVYGKKSEEFEVNCFDGEGLISPEYAEKLGAALARSGQPESAGATSFQIRLPFGKGMLHRVDFQAFCRDEFGMDPEKDAILDHFGFPRRIADIRIVLTVSMFKAHAWVRSSFGADGKDPMKEYFRRFHEYEHALYVLRTDRSLWNAGYVGLNYQFLNTGVLKSGEFDALVENSLREYTEKLAVDPAVQRAYLLGPEEDEEGEADGEEDEKQESKLKALLREEPLLLQDANVKNLISGAVHAQYLSAMKGTLMVRGENRFLSGDLLFLLREFAHRLIVYYGKDPESGAPVYRILSGAGGKRKTRQATAFYRELDRQRLDGRFYAPVNPRTGIVWEGKEAYAVLRNPHLSRNEQCAMPPYVPRHAKRNLYQKYLGELTGVLMLPFGSPDAERLGGADFDGDMVKIFDEEDFSASSLSSYRENPLVQIPHGKEKPKTIPEVIRFEDIRDGFNSRVGQLSNLAIKIGEAAYNENIGELSGEELEERRKMQESLLSEENDYPAISCILVGQEIDKAKTGVPPHTEEVQKRADDLDFRFIAQKDELSGKRVFHFHREEDGSFAYRPAGQSGRKARKGEMRIAPAKAGDPNLERMMYGVLDTRERLIRERRERPEESASAGAAETLRYRRPEREIPWELRLEFLLNMIAYTQTLRTAAAKNKLRGLYAETPYSAYIYNILYKQHDSEHELFGEKKDRSIPEMAEAARMLALRLSQADPGAVKELLEQSKKEMWVFTPKEERRAVLRRYFAPEKYQKGEGESSALADYSEYENDFALAAEMLSDFSVKGYLLLSYVLKDAIARQERESDHAERDLLDEGRDDTVFRRLAMAAVEHCRREKGRKVPPYAAELLMKKYPSAELLRGLAQRLPALLAEGTWSAEYFHDEVLKMKHPFQEKRRETLDQMDEKGLLALAEAAAEVFAAYEPVRAACYQSFLDVDRRKQDVDEDGVYQDESLKKALGDQLWPAITKAFAGMGYTEEDAVSCWTTLQSRYDTTHAFLWDVVPEEHIRGLIERGAVQKGEEDDVR